MALITTAGETAMFYIFTVTDNETGSSYEYKFTKDQDVHVSKREAELLAQHEIDKMAKPTPVQL